MGKGGFRYDPAALKTVGDGYHQVGVGVGDLNPEEAVVAGVQGMAGAETGSACQALALRLTAGIGTFALNVISLSDKTAQTITNYERLEGTVTARIKALMDAT